MVWGILQINKPKGNTKSGLYFLWNRSNKEFIRMEGVMSLVKDMSISAANFG